ncbi:MAG: 2Fe-2S iron-sulfur cluster-binding protein [Dehalobacterium sp.]
MIQLTIDGKLMQAEEGMTILELANRQEIYIPHLCYHPALSNFGSCRICMVEVEKGGKSKVEAACTYPVEEGLVVITNSPKIQDLRKTILELLIARCPEVMVLKEIARKLGIKPAGMPVMDQDKKRCILCGKCVRVCKEVIGKSAVSFAHRGNERKVSAPFDMQSEDCIGCTACNFVCPAWAIKVEMRQDQKYLVPWKTIINLAHCKKCGNSYIPEKVKTFLMKEEGDLPDDYQTLCPDCRRKNTAERVISKGENYWSTSLVFNKSK